MVVRQFHVDLETLRDKLLELGSLAEVAMGKSITALTNKDVDLALQIIEEDNKADRLDEEINDFAILLIAKQQPVAIDLRRIFVAIKISTDVERIADFAVNIAKSTIRIGKSDQLVVVIEWRIEPPSGHATGQSRCLGADNRQGIPGTAVRAAHALAAVLGHHHVDRRQLLDLMARRVAVGDPLALGEDVATPARAGPVVDELVHRPRRQQRPARALVAGLGALLAARAILATPGRRARGIRAGRLRRVARVATQPTFQLRDPLLLLGHALLQPLDLLVHPQQHRNDDVLALLVDRLGLVPLHTTGFDGRGLCPPTD
jgi:hypothetical protein